jgi:Flp pilus assembly protein TadB
MRIRRNRADWDVIASPEDKERARLVLLERLKSGEIRYQEYQKRLIMVEKSRYVAQLYKATFDKLHFMLIGDKWIKRLRVFDAVVLVLIVVFVLAGHLLRIGAWAIAVLVGILGLINLTVIWQWSRYRKIKSITWQNHSV